MKPDQAKAAIQARTGEHVSILFDDLLGSTLDSFPSALTNFSARVARIMSVEQAALQAIDGVGDVRIAGPREDDESLRRRVLDAGARKSVNQARVENAKGNALDELAGYYQVQRRGVQQDGSVEKKA